MTNKPAALTIARACDTLASRASNHVRITHLVSQGLLRDATDILLIRMENYLSDYLEDDLEDQEMIDAAKLINCLPGLFAKMELRQAAYRELQRMDPYN